MDKIEEIITETEEDVSEILEDTNKKFIIEAITWEEIWYRILDKDWNEIELFIDEDYESFTKEWIINYRIKTSFIDDIIVRDEIVYPDTNNKVSIRMRATHKDYKSGNDYYLDKKDVKRIPKKKYKLI